MVIRINTIIWHWGIYGSLTEKAEHYREWSAGIQFYCWLCRVGSCEKGISTGVLLVWMAKLGIIKVAMKLGAKPVLVVPAVAVAAFDTAVHAGCFRSTTNAS